MIFIMMERLITEEFTNLFLKYPLHSQNTETDPLVVTKLYDTCGSGSWFLIEYCVKSHIAFGYVTGLAPACDEWGYIDVRELEELKHPIFQLPRIERDIFFTPKPMSEVRYDLEMQGEYDYS